MSSIQKTMYELASFAQKADIQSPMRVSISFGSLRDQAMFEAEMMREKEIEMRPNQALNHEFHICGIQVRLLS